MAANEAASAPERRPRPPVAPATRVSGTARSGTADVDTMSQLFHRNTNIYSRVSIVAVLAFLGFLGWVVTMLYLSGYHTKQADFVEQPIQFSHAHHVGGMGIDCRYCHTSVEESAFANIPPT
jgi:hypothetical protein